MNIEIVLNGLVHPQEDSVKYSSRSKIRNLVKTQPILQVSSWSLGGHGHSQ